MQLHYLEYVTKEVDAVADTFAAANGVSFSAPVPELGNARTATVGAGYTVGVRAPMHDAEIPVVRPYWLVPDIKAALEKVEAAGGFVALPGLEIPGHGMCAIYIQGGNEHGLWQL